MSDADALRRRTLEWHDPRAQLERAVGMRPLDYLRAMMRGELPRPPIGVYMNMDGVEIEEGRAVIAAEPGEEHYNAIGMVHAGVAMTLLDTAMGFAVHSTLPQGARYSTVEVNAKLVRPITAETGRITCEASVVHRGRSVATAEGRVVDGRERVVAHGSCTCVLFPAP